MTGSGRPRGRCMTDIILFHSVLGLRPIERHLAECLRACGHAVALPDLYQGAATDDLDEGFAIKARIGWGAICLKAREALASTPGDAVLAGISMGAGVVAEFWASRPLAAGVLLLHGLATVLPTYDPACPSNCMSRTPIHCSPSPTSAPGRKARRQRERMCRFFAIQRRDIIFPTRHCPTTMQRRPRSSGAAPWRS